MSSEIKEAVRSRYAKAAISVTNSQKSSCCGGGKSCSDPITSDLYASGETALLPDEAVLASLGCGNPTALAQLSPGEVVLDLGSGGGIDVLLSSRRVGPNGFAYGLDMTDEMLELARANAKRAGATNVEFLKGEIEAIPLPDNSVDVIISNCVINLSADKPKALAEAFRILKPGGRFAVSDIVRTREISPVIRKSMELWAGCIAGALAETEYRDLLADAGFESIGVEATRVYRAADARDLVAGLDMDEETFAAADGAFMSAFVRAQKPA